MAPCLPSLLAMSATLVTSGEIPDDGIVSLLSTIEARRTTGVISFEAAGRRGEVGLVAGQIAIDEDAAAEEDPLELLLALRAGRYSVYQRLPPLPVSSGSDEVRTGSLSVHVPADLMNYCERAGLTGMLHLENGDRIAQASYDCGELNGIRLDGDGDDDLSQIFGWDEGVFRVEAWVSAPLFEEGSALPAREDDRPAVVAAPPPPPRRDSTGRHFLRVVEVPLASIVKTREERRPADRSGPPLPPLPEARGDARLSSRPPAPQERADATVRVIYLGGPGRVDVTSIAPGIDPAGRSSSSPYAHVDLPTTRKRPALYNTDPPGAPPTRPTEAHLRTERSHPVVALVWIMTAVVLALGVLAVLARLPTMN